MGPNVSDGGKVPLILSHPEHFLITDLQAPSKK